jgi:hypothetical protein
MCETSEKRPGLPEETNHTVGSLPPYSTVKITDLMGENRFDPINFSARARPIIEPIE